MNNSIFIVLVHATVSLVQRYSIYGCNWVVLAPRHCLFTVTLLTVYWGSSSSPELSWKYSFSIQPISVLVATQIAWLYASFNANGTTEIAELIRNGVCKIIAVEQALSLFKIQNFVFRCCTILKNSYPSVLSANAEWV